MSTWCNFLKLSKLTEDHKLLYFLDYNPIMEVYFEIRKSDCFWKIEWIYVFKDQSTRKKNSSTSTKYSLRFEPITKSFHRLTIESNENTWNSMEINYWSRTEFVFELEQFFSPFVRSHDSFLSLLSHLSKAWPFVDVFQRLAHKNFTT